MMVGLEAQLPLLRRVLVERQRQDVVKRGEALLVELRAKAEGLGLTVLGGEYFTETREGAG